jgi:hypothetical protein
MAVGQVAVGQGSVRGLCIRSSALPSAGITKRSHFAAQAIRRLRPFGVLSDSTTGVLGLTKVGLAPIGKLSPDNSLEHS